MAFAYTITSRVHIGVAQKRETYGGKIVLLTGTFTNAPGDTGGDIPTGADHVAFATASDKTAANPIKVDHETVAGTITLTTTDGDDGTWMAVCHYLNK